MIECICSHLEKPLKMRERNGWLCLYHREIAEKLSLLKPMVKKEKE